MDTNKINLDVGLLRLNLGSGRTTYPGFINLDFANLPETELRWNLEKLPLPFKDNSVSEIICEHALEHLSNFTELLEDLYRITAPRGRWYFVVPYYKYEGTFRDPTHKCFFSENTFDYFTEGNTFDYYSSVRLKVLKKKLRNSSKTNIRTSIKKLRKYVPFKSFLNNFLWNLYSEVYFELEVVKEDTAKNDKTAEEKITTEKEITKDRDKVINEWRGIKKMKARNEKAGRR